MSDTDGSREVGCHWRPDASFSRPEEAPDEDRIILVDEWPPPVAPNGYNWVFKAIRGFRAEKQEHRRWDR